MDTGNAIWCRVKNRRGKMIIEKIPGESARDYNRRLFIAQYKRSTGRYCMCISPIMDGESVVMGFSSTMRCKKCKRCGNIILETANP
jgi:hypothetical protein